MKHSLHHFTATLGSLLLFVVAALGVAGFSYQLFAPNGQLKLWIAEVWDFNPLLLIVLGGVFLLIKHWLESINPGRKLADALIVGALMSGLYVLFKVFVGV